ncbi:hypothetical protein EAS61_02370 [Bradyrhizobium zhanjiangense]|uniref:Uncharacterized protein n=1 Tax=Bradyrhizobium zhanjiangense TaxID=1325107 RepID=A0A4Q0QZA7_9BRAD|nr:hypothetical protein EAS61_02370 [Bradyrhizobium zhanjiangense]
MRSLRHSRLDHGQRDVKYFTAAKIFDTNLRPIEAPRGRSFDARAEIIQTAELRRRDWQAGRKKVASPLRQSASEPLAIQDLFAP